tara:strand:- start:570 stop:1604 length:1035 start_codon:yes stop_codon:yes gene_type:complete
MIAKNSWGGGNAFLKIICKCLKEKGHEIFFNLNRNDLDAIFIIDPRFNNPYITFPLFDAINYCLFKNKKTLIIHRINECNKKRYKSKLDIDRLLFKTNKFSDYSIFVSRWLRSQNIWKNKNNFNSRIILNGSDINIFNNKGKRYWKKNKKFKFVTHHWSSNWNKGFKYYKILDKLIEKPYWKSKIEFNFIGNIPENLKLKNTNLIKPLNDYKLAKKLKEFDGYITGSLFEPGSNHQNEGALCGLPLFYINHSSMPEYCKNYGVSFNEKNFEKKLKIFIKNYTSYKKNLNYFKYNSNFLCQNFIKLINDIKIKKIKREKKKNLILYIYFFLDKLKFILIKYFKKR